MTNLGFGTADVGGAFVKDLALELGKAPATLVAYLKKHLPATLNKRKNANNRLANFITEAGVAGLRAHYTPATYSESSELQRLREENARLRLENERLQKENEELHQFAKANASRCSVKAPGSIQKIRDAHAVDNSNLRKNLLQTLLIQEEEYHEQALESYNKTTASRKPTTARSESNVVRFPTRE